MNVPCHIELATNRRLAPQREGFYPFFGCSAYMKMPYTESDPWSIKASIDYSNWQQLSRVSGFFLAQGEFFKITVTLITYKSSLATLMVRILQSAIGGQGLANKSYLFKENGHYRQSFKLKYIIFLCGLSDANNSQTMKCTWYTSHSDRIVDVFIN